VRRRELGRKEKYPSWAGRYPNVSPLESPTEGDPGAKGTNRKWKEGRTGNKHELSQTVLSRKRKELQVRNKIVAPKTSTITGGQAR